MNFQRYLSAKRTVDDRALNRRVEGRLAAELSGRESLCAFEVGCGIGTTIERLLTEAWLPDEVRYTAIDRREANVAIARKRLPERAAAQGYAVGERDEKLVFSRGKRQVSVEFVVGDAFDVLAESRAGSVDLVVAQSFADLVGPLDALGAFRNALASGGVAYLPLTFDGETAFEPVADREFERRLVRTFHDHLDESGDSRAGRHLLSSVSENGEVLAVGSSDWVVRPGKKKGKGGASVYPADEAYFLHCIVSMVSGAVEKEGTVRSEQVEQWRKERESQISAGELVYVAHQLDLLVR
ncbi:class I SAM-dependent methyltransferase [Halorussus halophilus]|uniref:class I SAM-dependent methyltransferase n=1 Tax=Halorussus halophilus TaxID=2650975 RepID=UPI001300F909|nr:class I SAM-dependent methyltransferase [Halorussus halophilus]